MTKGVELEIAHVLFIDIVGYSKLLIDEQRDVEPVCWRPNCPIFEFWKPENRTIGGH